MTDLAKRTWPEARALFDERTIAILPVGSTEPHGPHLPLDTDVTIALAQGKAAIQALGELGIKAVQLPPVAYGVTRFTDGFEGWVSLRPGTLWALLEDVIESLSDQGIRRIVLSNGHLEPEHVQILRGVVTDYPAVTATQAHVIFPDNTRRRWAQTLSPEFQSGDCHAGSYESSIVMAADPDSVRNDERAKLPAVEIELIGKMRSGVKSFLDAGAQKAYCGDPAAASAEEGQELIRLLGDMIVGSCREAWPELF